ncbi:four helix bundle protein [Marinifilum caeruleilacunae]|uniref:Four helix bundle protein n=1 Tax=Marinifilum caeruleilacunae TaxID=2499076 RepID=A0ABX1WRU3_9BACT|nr:four helix bundle protein [Marinifilum caeruleilacunae]NOU58812.1 four helix bundle protein [Marinifilum caeruleilacunae]
MKKINVLQQKSFDFAVRIVNLCRYLNEEKKEYTLSKQLLRSGTSIGANVEEAIGGQSEKDFFAKLTIAYKETRETHYWVRLLSATHYLTNGEGQSLLDDTEELLRIIGSIQKTIKSRNS